MELTDEKIKGAVEQARAQLESIAEMVAKLDGDEEAAREAIEEDALSVEVRSDWHAPGDTADDGEYLILLCTGGPAVRIVGGLGRWHEPETARLECQDWFTPWTEVPVTADEEKTLLAYASVFYFGD